LQGKVLLLGTDGERAALVTLCGGTARPAWTHTAIARRELDLDHLTLERPVVPAIDGWRPAQARLAFRTRRYLPLPVDLEITGGEPGLRLGLPLGNYSGGVAG
jgi:hypothetical protein